MISLFQLPPDDGPDDGPDDDPRTSFREVQMQDVVIWSRTLHDSYLARVQQDIDDQEAVDWFLSEAVGPMSFRSCCALFGIDGEAVRAMIHQKISRRKP